MATLPLSPWSDHYPGLAVEDGRLGEMIEQARDDIHREDAIGVLVTGLYPNWCWGN